MSIVGDRVKKLREKIGITQLQLADEVGINNSVLSRIEAGKRPVEDEEVRAFVKFFDTNSDYLLGLSDDPSPKNAHNKELAADSDDFSIAFLGGAKEVLDEEEAAHLEKELEMFRAFKEKRRREREQKDK